MTSLFLPAMTLRCLRCGHEWMRRQTAEPRCCAKCNSPYWNVPRQRDRTSKPTRKPSAAARAMAAVIEARPLMDMALLDFMTIGPVKTWELTKAQADQWRQDFPNLDIMAESRKARAWILASLDRRKTAKGMPRFLVGWFGRARVEPPPAQSEAVRRALGPAYGKGDKCPHDPVCQSKTWCQAQQKRDSL